MDTQKFIVASLFFIGSYILIDTLITIIRIDVEQDVQESVLRQSLMGKNHKNNSHQTKIILHDIRTDKPKKIWGFTSDSNMNKIRNNNPNRNIIAPLNPGNVYTNNNQDLWRKLNKVDNTKVDQYKKCNYFKENVPAEIRDTIFHGDKMMDVYRNDMVYKYDMDDKITNVEDIDPYDPEVYASYQNRKRENVKPRRQPTQVINNSLINHTHVSKDVKQNPTPVKYPILSDTHYAVKEVNKYNYVPPAVHCDIRPSINKTLSSNLISDNMLNERTGSYKVMSTNHISNEMIPVDEINYDVKELTPQFNPLDNHLHKVKDRSPVKSMIFHSNDNVCGFDSKFSDYAQLENNDLKNTTSA
jgi:hypothetical protein